MELYLLNKIVVWQINHQTVKSQTNLLWAMNYVPVHIERDSDR